MFSKKFLGAALSLVLAAATTVPALAATGFSDVKDTDSLASVAQRLNSLGIMQGVKHNDGTVSFDGASTFTRAQAAKVFVVAKGLGKVQAKTGKFTDVTKDNWAYSVINVAAQYGIVNGTSDTTFAPKDEVTYGQLAAMAIRTLGYTEDDLDGSTFPYNYVQKAADLGLLDGIDSLDVDVPATRGDVAKVVDAMLNAKTKTQQTAYDAVVSAGNTYKGAASFFDSVAAKFGVTPVAGGVITDTSLVDSSLKANQFKISRVDASTKKLVQDSTVYTFIDASKDLSGSFYKNFDGTFYVAKNTSNVVFFADSNLKGAATDSKAVDSYEAGKGLKLTSSDPTTVASTYYKLADDAVLYLNGKPATLTTFATLGKASIKLVSTAANDTYNAVIATKVSDPVVVKTAPTSDDAKTQAKLEYGTGSANYPLTYADPSTGLTVGANVYVSGSATKLTEIKANDVVVYSKSDDATLVNLEVYRSTDKGKVVSTKATDSSVTLDNGKTYVLATGVTATLGNTYTFLLGKDGKAYAANGDSVAATTTVGGAVYGYVTGISSTKDSWTNDYVNKVRVVNADKTTSELTIASKVQNAVTTAMINTPVYYTVSNGVATINALTTTATLDVNKVTDTVIVVLNSADSSKSGIVAKSTVDLTKLTNKTVLAAIKNPAVNSFGDYYLIVLDKDQYASVVTSGVTDASSYGYVGNYVGTTLTTKADGTTVTADVYNVFEKGAVRVVNALPGVLTTGTGYKSLTTDGNVVTVQGTVAVSAVAKKVAAVDSLRIRFDGEDSPVLVDSANVKVYNVKDPNAIKVAAYGDIAVGDSVKYVLNADGKITVVLINK